jgi:hypothetical protein
MKKKYLFGLLPLIATAHAATGTLTLRDGLGNAQTVPAETANGNITPHSAPEVAGAAVSLANPMPTTSAHGVGALAGLSFPVHPLALTNPTFGAGPYGMALTAGTGTASGVVTGVVGETIEALVTVPSLTSTVQVAAGQNIALWVGVYSNGAPRAQYGSVTLAGTTPISPGTAHWLTLSVGPGGGFLLDNGIVVATSATTWAASAPNLAAAPFAVRDLGGDIGSFPFTGPVEELVVTASQKYTAAYTVPPGPFVGNEGMSALYHLGSNGLDTRSVALGAVPSGAIGAQFYLGPNDTVSYTIAPSALTATPTVTVTASGDPSSLGDSNWPEALAAGQGIYITGTTGSPSYRWY